MAQIAPDQWHRLRALNWRLALVQGGALATFLLLPLWYRYSMRYPAPLLLPRLYVSYFLVLLPMLWTIGCWLIFGRPGLSALRRDPVRRLWAICLLLLAVWGVASTTWAFMRLEEPDVGTTAAIQLAVVALFAVVMACAGPPARAVVLALAAGLIANSAITILQARAQGSIGLIGIGEFTFGPGRVDVSVIRAGELEYVRPMGLMPHPNPWAGILLVGLLASAALFFSPRRAMRWFGALAWGLGLWALLLTFSRAAWIGLAAGAFAVLPLVLRRARLPGVRAHLAAVAVLSLVLGVLFLASYRPFLGARVGEGTESLELRSVSDRLVFTDFALRSIAERPILGVGIDNFPWRTSYYLVETFYDLRGHQVHHVMLAAWAELGVVGFALVSAALISGLEAGLRALRLPDAPSSHVIPDSAAQMALLAVVFAYIAIGLLDYYPWTLLHFQTAWWGSLALAGRREAT